MSRVYTSMNGVFSIPVKYLEENFTVMIFSMETPANAGNAGNGCQVGQRTRTIERIDPEGRRISIDVPGPCQGPIVGTDVQGYFKDFRYIHIPGLMTEGNSFIGSSVQTIDM